MKVLLKTLGCRLNQYETQAMRELMVQAGFEETREAKEAGIFVLNTCTVTADADRESRYQIRKFHRENPEASIIVTGCYVERNQKEIEAIPGVSFTLRNQEKQQIVNVLESCTGFSLPQIQPVSRRAYTGLSVSESEGRMRAYIKIQDGCNHACSFCKVVLVRGPSRSRAMEEVCLEAERLAASGHQEVVLTGIQLGAFGREYANRPLLPELLQKLSEIDGIKQIRLSSIEPTDVTDELIEVMGSLDTVCPHLHIPLQSGDDEILKRMNRRYTGSFYRSLIQKLKARVKDFVLTLDVMAGFPGETKEQFQNTASLLIESEPYKMHIFPYSAREGTKAALLDGPVPPEEIKRRRDVLVLLDEKLRRKVQERFIGRTFPVIAEEDIRDGWGTGHAPNFLKVRFRAFEKEYNGCMPIRLETIEYGELTGTVVPDERIFS